MPSISAFRLLVTGTILTMSSSALSQDQSTEDQGQLAIVNPPGLYDPTPNGYSHLVVAKGTSAIVFIAGQGGEDEHGNLSPEFALQVRQAYANLQTALEAVGPGSIRVTKITTYVVDYDQSKLGIMTGVVREVFGDSLPAQTLVPVPRLALDGMLFEVDALAVIHQSTPVADDGMAQTRTRSLAY